MKHLTITSPARHEIDLDKSNLSTGEIYFKEVKKTITYNDVAAKLLIGNRIYYINVFGDVESTTGGKNTSMDSNNSTTREQLEAILNLNKLCNVAKYLNGDWLPICVKDGNINIKYYISMDSINLKLEVYSTQIYRESVVYFKTEELAKQAIEILGEDEIRKALTLNH